MRIIARIPPMSGRRLSMTKVKFISAEPLLGNLDLRMAYWNSESGTHYNDAPELLKDVVDWVIIGGESGNDNGKYKYRPAKLDWYKSIIQQCKQNNRG